MSRYGSYFRRAKKNLRLWAQNLGQQSQLRRYGEDLEGGIIVQTDEEGNIIALPSSYIHAVFTTGREFLYSINYPTTTDLPLMYKGVRIQLERITL